jgi:hypothetical protein
MALYLGFFQSVMLAFSFMSPPIDPESRWGIFAPRKGVRPRLWMLMALIALIAPSFALISQDWQENRRRAGVRRASLITEVTQSEHQQLAAAREQDRLAAVCRAKDAAGAPWEGMTSWADQARDYERSAASLRSFANRHRELLKKWEKQSW